MEPWLIEFENEEINDERWSCLVSAVVESKPEDEECLKILTEFVAIGKAPIIRTVCISDVVALFKTSTAGKKKDETKVNKSKMDNVDNSSLLAHPPPRFQEIVSYLSKYANVADGSCKLPPRLMAYAVKYLVLGLKDQDYFQRRVARTTRRRSKEAEVKAEVLKILKGDPRERVNVNAGERNEFWHKDRFDILGDPLKDGPFLGPEMYIVLYDFYDPFMFPELQRLKVPFTAVTKIENFVPMYERPVSGAPSRKSEMISNFWRLLQEYVNGGGMDDIALLKCEPPFSLKGNNVDVPTDISTGLIAVLYSIFNICRLHQTFLQQMKVHGITESLELLDLSKCDVYNELCDALVTEDPNAEIFVLYSMVEQVVAGVPETENRTLKYVSAPSCFFICEEDVSDETPAPEERHEPELPQRERRSSGLTASICFHDDKISLAAISINPNVLQAREIFERFLINSIAFKIRNKFARLTPALKAQSDFNFFQVSLNSEENKDMFKIKLLFVVIMRLVENIRAFDTGCGNVSSKTESIQSLNEEAREKVKVSEGSVIPNESQDIILCEIDNLFYKPLKTEKAYVMSSSGATGEVRKAEAIFRLKDKSNATVENVDGVCGVCPKFSVHDKSTEQPVQTKKLEQFLESHEITHLNDPNLLADKAKFEAFVKKQAFYETFEPNRTVQKLQELFDEYNTIQYTYFTPTDTLFILGHNDFDFRGVYHSLKSGFITSPLALRDFVRYVIPDNKKWIAAVNGKYIKFLKEVQMKMLDEEKRRNRDIKCGLLKMYKEMTESERRRFLGDEETGESKEIMSDTGKGVAEKVMEVSLTDLDDLPVKTKQKQQNAKFFGINCGGSLTQVNVVNYEFHSQDGSTVSVKTRSWLYSNSVVTMTIQRFENQVIVHRWLEDSEKRLMLFRDPCGILITFGLNPRPYPVRITQPNGLIIEIGKGVRHIKQTYLKPYRWGENITKEKCRCNLYDGSVLIFRVDGAVDVLYPSGTKHTCYRFASEGVEIYDTIASTGELWLRDECSKCRRLVKTMTMIMGVDSETGEAYYKREDGTSCMLWPDGKLVTTYPDGTKITSTPKFEKEELTVKIEGDVSVTSVGTGKQRISFVDEPLAENSEGFTVVSCSYLSEHPNYAAVFSESAKFEVRILGKIKVQVSSTESLRIECHHAVLNVSSENADFYTVCRNCGKRSISTVIFDSENLLSKSKDFYDKTFYVYSSGEILHQSENENNAEEKLEKFGESSPSGSYESCQIHKSCKSQRRCLGIDRDLTGLEFIDVDTLCRYIGNLPEDAYYDLGRQSADKTELQHSFFSPVYRLGREKYIMSYEKNDGFPSRLTRKNLKSGNPSKCGTKPWRKEARSEQPKTMIARFIRVILPDPVTVMKQISKEIAIYQRRSLDMSRKYDKMSKKGKQGPFAKCIAKELELIASTLCSSLKLYPHTCTVMPYTEMDIHTTAHKFGRSTFFVEENPDDCRMTALPRCKRIPKPLKHKVNDENIPELMVYDDDDAD